MSNLEPTRPSIVQAETQIQPLLMVFTVAKTFLTDVREENKIARSRLESFVLLQDNVYPFIASHFQSKNASSIKERVVKNIGQ